MSGLLPYINVIYIYARILWRTCTSYYAVLINVVLSGEITQVVKFFAFGVELYLNIFTRI